jgi:hypothetical protein
MRRPLSAALCVGCVRPRRDAVCLAPLRRCILARQTRPPMPNVRQGQPVFVVCANDQRHRNSRKRPETSGNSRKREDVSCVCLSSLTRRVSCRLQCMLHVACCAPHATCIRHSLPSVAQVHGHDPSVRKDDPRRRAGAAAREAGWVNAARCSPWPPFPRLPLPSRPLHAVLSRCAPVLAPSFAPPP